MSGPDRSRIERVRRVRELQAELALGQLRRAHVERVAADVKLKAATVELGEWDAAHHGSSSAALFGLRRAGLGSQAQLVARSALEVFDAALREDADRSEWTLRAQKVEGLDRLIGRISAQERDLELRSERAVLDEFVASRTHRELLQDQGVLR